MLQQDDDVQTSEAQVMQDLTQVLKVSSDCEPPGISQRTTCNICNKSFKSYSERNKHVKIHFEGKYVCKYCGKKFKSVGNKNFHERSVHAGKSCFCKLCGHRFKYFKKQPFRTHLIRKHSSYTCYTGHTLEQVETEMDKDKSLGSLEEVEEMIGTDTILKMDLDQLMEMVGYDDQKAEERSSHTEDINIDTVSRMENSDDTSTSVMDPHNVEARQVAEEGSSHSGDMDNVNIDPLDLEAKQSINEKMSAWSVLEQLSAGASSKNFPNMTNMPNTVTEFNFPSCDEDENVPTLIVNSVSENDNIPKSISEEIQGDIEVVEASQITENVSATEEPLVGANKCSLAVQIGEDVITVSGDNAELVTAAKIVLNQFFNVSSAEVPVEKATVPEEETVETVTAKNDSDNEDLVDVQKSNVTSESENEELEDEDLKSVLTESQFPNIQSAGAEVSAKDEPVETEIVKNDSNNEDLVDAQKADVISGSDGEEEDKKEQDENSESIENTHNVEKFRCPICEKEFRQRQYYREHFKSHKYGKQFKCEKCDSTFSMKSQFLKHEKFQCKYVSTKVACPECSKEFRNPSNLRYHMVLHDQPERVGTNMMRYSDEIKQEALELLKKYSKAETARKLKVTYSAVNNWDCNSKKSFNCSHCGKKMCDSTHLRRHERACKSDMYKYEDGKYACNSCNLQSTSLEHMREHIKSKHEGIKYPCNQCDKQYSRSGLREHKRYKHMGIVHHCPAPECGKKTITKSDLKKHMRRHHVKQEEPYRRQSEQMFISR